jgi:hypothetical protein
MSIRSVFGVVVMMEQVSMALAFRVAPRVPNTSEGEDRVVGHGETERSFNFSVLAPLVEAVSRD